MGSVVDRLGISVESVADGRATARLRITADHLNGHGVAHGGILFLLADAAFDAACNSHGPVTLARAAEIAFTEAAQPGDELTAVAEERVRRGRSGVYDVSVIRPDGTVVALFRGHSQSRPGDGPT